MHSLDGVIMGFADGYCPFANRETHSVRFDRELDAEAIEKAVWLRPEVVAQIDECKCKRCG
jgi:hypothetical protein